MNPFPRDESNEMPHPVPGGALSKRDAWSILLITSIGLLLRVCTLRSQSFWVDEYYAALPAHMPSLSSCLRYVSFLAPDSVPLGLSLNYLWGQLVGPDSMVLMRLLPVLFGTACIPLLYTLTRSLYGRFPAVVAASCLALSPFHIDIAQGMRPNALADLLALVSLGSFMGMLRGDSRRAWAINITANALLSWTHLLNLLLLATEGFFVLLLLRKRPKRALAWIAAMILAVCCASLWISSVRSTIPDEKDDFFMHLPPLRVLMSDLLADDAVMSADPFSFQGETWGFLPKGLQRTIVEAHAQVDSGMMLFFGVCLAWLASQTFASARRNWREHAGQLEKAEPMSSAFLLGIIFLPILALVALAFVYRPAILPRYTSYSSFACYAAAGAAITAIRQKPQRLAALAALFVLYTYQLSVALPATTRTNWLGAGRLIDSGLAQNDLVLVKGTYLDWDVFRFNWKPRTGIMLPAYTLESISVKSAAFLAENSRTAAAARPKVWAVIEPFTYTLPPLRLFEESLTHRGLRFARTDFKGMNGVHVYRIEWADSGAPPRPPEPIEAKVDYAAILSDLGYASNDPSALNTLRLMIDAEFPRTPFYFAILALQCLNENCLSMGAAAANRAIALDPNYPFAHEMRAAILGANGDAAGALAAYEQAIKKDHSGFLREYSTLFDAWYRRQDATAAAEECRRLDRLGYYMPFAFLVKSGIVQQPSYLTTCGAAEP